MLTKHKELLAHLATVEEAARELEAQGCNVEDVIRNTRRSAAIVAERIRHYERQPESKAAVVAAKGEP